MTIAVFKSGRRAKEEEAVTHSTSSSRAKNFSSSFILPRAATTHFYHSILIRGKTLFISIRVKEFLRSLRSLNLLIDLFGNYPPLLAGKGGALAAIKVKRSRAPQTIESFD